MKRYLILLGVVVGLGAIAIVAGRSLRFSAGPEPVPAATPEVTLDLTIGADGSFTPPVASVPKEHRVRLAVTNRDSRPVTLTLAGYEERLGVVRVPPDSTWRGEFVADLPGDDFAWMLDGAPAGRLEVKGSHLVDGHR